MLRKKSKNLLLINYPNRMSQINMYHNRGVTRYFSNVNIYSSNDRSLVTFQMSISIPVMTVHSLLFKCEYLFQ